MIKGYESEISADASAGSLVKLAPTLLEPMCLSFWLNYSSAATLPYY